MSTESKWLTLKELELEKQLEANFWERFHNAPWQQYPKSSNKKIGAGLYNKIKNYKTMMNKISLRYFSVFLKIENIPPSPMMSIIFDAAVNYCRKNGYGDSFSMDTLTGFKIENAEVFKVAKITLNGSDISVKTDEKKLNEYVKNGHIVEVFFMEDAKSIL